MTPHSPLLNIRQDLALRPPAALNWPRHGVVLIGRRVFEYLQEAGKGAHVLTADVLVHGPNVLPLQILRHLDGEKDNLLVQGNLSEHKGVTKVCHWVRVDVCSAGRCFARSLAYFCA